MCKGDESIAGGLSVIQPTCQCIYLPIRVPYTVQYEIINGIQHSPSGVSALTVSADVLY